MTTTKLCECGCGQPAPIAEKNDKQWGYIKGQPTRFRRGHYLKSHVVTKKRSWPSVEERFWRNVDKTGDCWLWTACTTGNGYGAIRFKGKQEGAHRLAWILANGEIPTGMTVMHSCDNPLCVRIDHLSLGTVQENSRDMAAKGRASRSGPGLPATGENNGSAVLQEVDVATIRQLHSTGKYTFKALADQYNVTGATIRNIVTRKNWKHVE